MSRTVAAALKRMTRAVGTAQQLNLDGDVYGFRTSLTVRHRDIVDGQPMPATVSRCLTESFLSQIPMLQRASLSRSDCAL
jgi:hypothetical protein